MKKASKTALIALVAGLAACSDGLVAPQNEAPAGEPVNGGGSMQALTGSDTVRFSITIDPSRQTIYYLGDGNSLVFPAHSLCDVSKSSYGDGEWDKPCTAATSPRPLASRRGWMLRAIRVSISPCTCASCLEQPGAVGQPDFRRFAGVAGSDLQHLLLQGRNSSCTDEAKKDPTLATVHNPITGKVTRRIKHFSGYNVAVGRDQESYDVGVGASASTTSASQASFSVASSQFNIPSPSTFRSTSKLMSYFDRTHVDLFLSRVEFLRRFSGYMLASG